MNEFPILLEDNIVASFRDDGFVVTPNVLSGDELKQYSTAVDAEVKIRTADDVRDLSEKTTYEQSFIQCVRLWETNAEVRVLSCHAGLAGIAAQLLGIPSVRMWQDQALYKEAGGRETTPHQDETFWPIGEEPLVSAWIPFDNVRIEHGAMAYVPGSHKAGSLRVVDITHSSEAYDILKDPALNGRTPQFVEVDAGSVIWHHGLTVHQAAPNTTQQTRRAFTVVYISSVARRIKEWPTYPLDREGIQVGETVRGEGMPILWPPNATLPTPPKLLGEKTGPQYEAPKTP
jgi:ectoine hydroxylase-related dioxygenase (phytanoyl-CoA dioxygenase family)